MMFFPYASTFISLGSKETEKVKTIQIRSMIENRAADGRFNKVLMTET